MIPAEAVTSVVVTAWLPEGLKNTQSGTRLKAAAVKATGRSIISVVCFIVITIFISVFVTESLRKQWGNCWKTRSSHSTGLHSQWLGTQILSSVCVWRGGLDYGREKKRVFFPINTQQWSSLFVISGFHSFSCSLAVFPSGEVHQSLPWRWLSS